MLKPCTCAPCSNIFTHDLDSTSHILTVLSSLQLITDFCLYNKTLFIQSVWPVSCTFSPVLKFHILIELSLLPVITKVSSKSTQVMPSSWALSKDLSNLPCL
eukprot:NODE_40_length_29852_cov_0.370215.p16 type:complete len:102 gc:universal NODE_40_length_29852_cov_0.370215:5221-5526(+)